MKNKISSKDKLIDAAVMHLNAEGLNSFTATTITKSANLGYGTFYKYFSSTEDLLESAIRKNVLSIALKIEKLNSTEENKTIAFMQALYIIFTDLCHGPTSEWLSSKPDYFVEIAFELTHKLAKKDFEFSIKNHKLKKDYLKNFDIKFKLIIWQLCGAFRLVSEGENYHDVAYELMRESIPVETTEEEVDEIIKLVMDRHKVKLQQEYK